ncbi:olfactory receptor 11A1-like [Trachemys scripta elegans]|uniref:olfactory receptor 11A1-like n=1 Tax=Trachemys scripta elegans TaxID=31138 RepID=UPI00155688E7|nr:olfactory receptor 11A1-like [Trachemys scripta elegans]
MAKASRDNKTSVTEFILLGFGDLPELQTLLFLLFLVIYIVTMAGNILIIVLVVTDQHLHTPMYYFLGNLSCLETCCSSTILPSMLASFSTETTEMSFTGCFMQLYVFASLTGVECYLLSVMSYDRYLTICKPLHYEARMNGRFCLQLAVGSWLSGFLASSIIISLASELIFCGPNKIDHFFCDFTPIVKLSCSNTCLVTLLDIVLSSVFTLPPFLLTLTSYVCIITTILRIPSTARRQKAFSTCSSHIIVVTVFYGTLMIVYMLPNTKRLRDLHKFFSLSYTVFTPMINPLIYSLRNKEVKEALRKGMWKCMSHT